MADGVELRDGVELWDGTCDSTGAMLGSTDGRSDGTMLGSTVMAVGRADGIPLVVTVGSLDGIITTLGASLG